MTEKPTIPTEASPVATFESYEAFVSLLWAEQSAETRAEYADMYDYAGACNIRQNGVFKVTHLDDDFKVTVEYVG
jgi:hypothetical protein